MINIDQKIESLIEEVIVAMNPMLLDDDYPDAIGDWDNWEEAIDYLIDKLNKIKEG